MGWQANAGYGRVVATPAYPQTVRPDEPVELVGFDQLLFTDTGWFAIDETNHKVAGVTPATLDQALALVGRGRVASVVGRLRPEVRGVDVDLTDPLAGMVVHTLTGWCRTRGLWHLARPSGGGPGRSHVLVVPGVHDNAFAELVARLRAEMRLGARQLDLREQLRPLSAPHRRGHHTQPADATPELLARLGKVLEPLPPAITAGRPPTKPAKPPATGPSAPLTPLPRPRRGLAEPWAQYLAQGRTAAASVDRDPTTRSQIELEATFALVVAGLSEPEAWEHISNAHPTAFIKARSRGRRWWWTTWNRCVLDADTWLSQHRGALATTPPTVQAVTQHARAVLESVWRSWPALTRHTDVEIYTVVLNRMDRVGATAVPIPQRDLVLDCAVASRTTVRAALARLRAAGLLEVDPTYSPGTTDTAHTLRLPATLTRPSELTDNSAVSPTGPSRFQPPHRPAARLSLRRSLGLPATTLLRHLPTQPGTPLPLPLLARSAGLVPPEQPDLTAGQRRTIRGYFQSLARAGLAQVDEQGAWLATAQGASAHVSSQGAGPADVRGQRLDQATREQITQERAQFRDAFNPQARAAAWNAQRAKALQRQAQATRARQNAWWNHLEPSERESRRESREAAFARLGPHEQARRKTQWALNRHQNGEDERARYDAWISAQNSGLFEDRRIERALAFATRPGVQRAEFVAGWCEYRARWGLPSPRRTRTSAVGSQGPEAALLRRPVPTVEELVLFDPATEVGVRVGRGVA